MMTEKEYKFVDTDYIAAFGGYTVAIVSGKEYRLEECHNLWDFPSKVLRAFAMNVLPDRVRDWWSGAEFNSLSKATYVALLAGELTERKDGKPRGGGEVPEGWGEAETSVPESEKVDPATADRTPAVQAEKIPAPAPAPAGGVTLTPEQSAVLGSLFGGGLSADQIKALIEAEVPKHVKSPKTVHFSFKFNAEEVRTTGRKHYMFPLVMAYLSVGVDLALVGPAGSGKTHLLIDAAKTMGRSFAVQNCNLQSTKSDLLGFVDATGTYRKTGFVRAFEEGGVFVADEFDRCNPAVAVILNGAVANRVLTTPDGETREAHKDFIFVAGMNTEGSGASAQYSTAQRLDASTLDRFVLLFIGYDEGLEAKIGMNDDTYKSPSCNIEKGGKVEQKEWYEAVVKARKFFDDKGWSNVLSPRATIQGCRLIEAGVGRHWLNESILNRRLNADQRKQLTAHLNA